MKNIIEGAYYRNGKNQLVGPMEKTDLYNNFVYIWREKVTNTYYTNFGQVFQNAKDVIIDLDISKPLGSDGESLYDEYNFEKFHLDKDIGKSSKEDTSKEEKFCKDCIFLKSYIHTSRLDCMNKQCREIDLVNGGKKWVDCHDARYGGKCGKEGLYFERI